MTFLLPEPVSMAGSDTTSRPGLLALFGHMLKVDRNLFDVDVNVNSSAKIFAHVPVPVL